jgi:hypothetical protein
MALVRCFATLEGPCLSVYTCSLASDALAVEMPKRVLVFGYILRIKGVYKELESTSNKCRYSSVYVFRN